MKFKPELFPNEPTGIAPNWEERIKNPEEWLYSSKLDGGRVELFHDGTLKGRSLKALPSYHMNRMAKDIMGILQLSEGTIIEAEFYSPEMNFSEIMHFFKTEDVTSHKTVVKYQKLWKKTAQGTLFILKGVSYPMEEFSLQSDADRKKAIKWPFPGRTPDWATTWHSSLKFYAFNITNMNFLDESFVDSADILDTAINTIYAEGMGQLEHDIVCLPQNEFEHIDELYQAFDQEVLDGGEGLIVKHKDCKYKTGRHTLKSGQVYKIKDDNREYEGTILSVLEGTVAREGSVKTIDKLGRSKTSQLKEDRIPSGLAKGFEVMMDDKNILTVSLNGYNHIERRQLLIDHADYSNKRIVFKGMAPVKIGGRPRHAMFTKGNIL